MRSLLALCLLSLAGRAAAQQVLDIPSKHLGDTRRVWVTLPDEYAISGRAYPLVLVLDGQDRRLRDLAVTATRYDAVLDFLDPEMPRQIVVGVESRERGKDFGPRGTAMRAFLLEELLPALRQRWRLSGFTTLVGHSLAGSFALEVACAPSGGIAAVVAVSPAIADASETRAIEACLEAWAAERPDAARSVFLVSGERAGDRTEESFRPNHFAIRRYLSERGMPGLRWGFLDIPGWSHSRTPLRGIPEGLVFVFSGDTWEVPDAVKREVLAMRRDPLATIDSFTAVVARRTGAKVDVPARWLEAAALLYAGSADSPPSRRARTPIERGLALYPERPAFFLLDADERARRGDRSGAQAALERARKRVAELTWLDERERARWGEEIREREARLR